MISERTHLESRRWLGAVGLPAVMALTGCASLQTFEPVIRPPTQFQSGATVPVEFIAPGSVGIRCAQRGAKFLGLPGVNSQACSNGDLVTMPNPCLLENAGWYADALCHELAHVNGWGAGHEGGSFLRDRAHGRPEYALARPPADITTDAATGAPMLTAALEMTAAPTSVRTSVFKVGVPLAPTSRVAVDFPAPGTSAGVGVPARAAGPQR